MANIFDIFSSEICLTLKVLILYRWVCIKLFAGIILSFTAIIGDFNFKIMF
jgi:hypothetical protein